jgi:hypothetical protein
MSIKANVVFVSLALGLFVASSFISAAAFGASAGPSLSKVPVYFTITPSSVGNGQKVTITADNKGTTTYTFNKRCLIYSRNPGGTIDKCGNASGTYSPGTHKMTETFDCGGQKFTGYEIVWVENTVKGYESYRSNKLSFHCG